MRDACPTYRHAELAGEEQRLGVNIVDRAYGLTPPEPVCVLFAWPPGCTDPSQGRYFQGLSECEDNLSGVLWTEDRAEAMRLTDAQDVQIAVGIARGDGWTTEVRQLAAWEI